MSVTCLCDRDAAVRRPEPPTAKSSRKEVLAFLYARNAERPIPRPVCPRCEYPVDRADMGSFRTDLCCTCELNLFQDLVWGVVDATSKKAVKRALKRIQRLRRLPK
jgi:hypothetical protein